LEGEKRRKKEKKKKSFLFYFDVLLVFMCHRQRTNIERSVDCSVKEKKKKRRQKNICNLFYSYIKII